MALIYNSILNGKGIEQHIQNAFRMWIVEHRGVSYPWDYNCNKSATLLAKNFILSTINGKPLKTQPTKAQTKVGVTEEETLALASLFDAEVVQFLKQTQDDLNELYAHYGLKA